MLIQKTRLKTPTGAHIVDGYSTSTTDGYSCDYVNKANTYSTNEVKTDETWIDGKPIYKKVIIGTITDSSSSFVNIAHNVSNIDTKIDVSASYIFSNSLFKTPNDAIIEMGFTDSAVQYANSNSYILNSTIRFTIKYTKTTD